MLSTKLQRRPIAEIEVKPHDRSFMSLGLFKKGEKPRGFCIELMPDDDQTKDVVAEIIEQPKLNQFEYMLRLTNSSNEAFSAEIWQL